MTTSASDHAWQDPAHDVASRRNYATTFIAEGAVLVSTLLVYRLVALGHGPEGFAEYALTRRALTLAIPFGLLGLDVAIARFVALAVVQRPRTAPSYLVAGLLVAASAVAVTIGLLIAFRGPLTELLFGSRDYTELTLVLPVLLVGATLHIVSYGSLRGFGRIGRANLLMVANHAMVPVAAVLTAWESLPQLLMTLGLGWTAVSLLSLLASPMSLDALRPRAEELLSFGIRRVPGDLAQLLFFALPAIIVVHVGTFQEAGIVALALSALGMVGSGVTPVSVVLLPKAAGMFGRESLDDLRKHVTRIAWLIVPLLVIGVVVVEMAAGQLLSAYLGPQFTGGAGALRIVILGALPWGTYVMLKSVVDARHIAAVNARNMGIGLGAFAVLAIPAAMISVSADLPLAAFVFGLYVLGILTVIEVRRSLQPSAVRRNVDGGAR